MWANRLASRREKNPQIAKKKPKLIEKVQFAWLFILLNSQHLFPPAKNSKNSYNKLNDVLCISDTLNSRLFKRKILPVVGPDSKLLKLLIDFAHVVKMPRIRTEHIHRSHVGTAAYLRKKHLRGIYQFSIR